MTITEDIKNNMCSFAEVCLQKPLKEYVIKPTKNRTYFGLEIHQGNLVKENDIKEKSAKSKIIFSSISTSSFNFIFFAHNLVIIPFHA